VQKYNRTIVRLFKNLTGYRRFSVNKLKYDCKANPISARPKKIQRTIMIGEFQAHEDPAKVKTTMNSTKVAAFNTTPSQSIDSNFWIIVFAGCGLYPGNNII
jgi:hypothetical protein